MNASLVDTGEATLNDAGTPIAADDLRSELDDAGFATEDIDRVLIAHFDIDHVGRLDRLEFSAPIYAVGPDASFLDGSRKPPLANHEEVLQQLTDFWLTSPSEPISTVYRI